MTINGAWYIGFPRFTPQVTFSGGTCEANFPITNLGGLPFAKVARFTNDTKTNTIVYGVLPQTQLINLFMICRDNISTSGLIKISLFEGDVTDSPEPSAIVTTGWIDRYGVIYNEDSPFASWDSGNWWDRTISESDREGAPQNKVVFIDGGFYARSFKLEIDDESNPDGFVQIGMLEVATATELDPAPQNGANYGFNARTTVTESEGGGEYFERRNKPRFFSGVLPMIERDVAQSTFYELLRRNDIDTPFIFYPDANDIINESRNTYLARLVNLDPITRVQYNYDGIPLSIKEVL